MERKYIAFISYCHVPRDMAIAQRLHTLIESYTVPKELRKTDDKKAGLVFRDREELAASSDLTADICRALDNAEFLLVVCSRESRQSIWVEREIRYFLQTHDRSHVIAVLADGEPNEAFPTALTKAYDPDSGIELEIEPMALDVRADDLRGALRKLRKEYKRVMAALLGCPYDMLVLRSQRRLMKRVIAAGLVLLVAMGLFSVVLWDKNRQITAEKERALYQESRLLTENAEAALQAGDYRTAIAYAVKALPNSSEADRPYLPQAEGVLLKAMRVMDNRSVRGSYEAVLEQSTDITDFCFSEDGKKIVTIDDYGRLICYDAATTNMEWSAFVYESGYGLSADSVHLFAGTHNRVFSLYRGTLSCHTVADGVQLWQRDVGTAVEDYIFYDSSRDALLVLEAERGYFWDLTAYRFCLLSGEWGALLKEIPFTQTEHLIDCEMPCKWGADANDCGAFSADGSVFVGAYIQREYETQKNTLKCYTIDLDAGKAEIFCERRLPEAEIAGVSVSQGETAALISLLREDTAQILRVDWQKGTLLWSAELPIEERGVIYAEDLFVRERGQTVYAACDNVLSGLSVQTGELLDSSELPGDVVSMILTGDGMIGFFLDSGAYGIAWRTQSGIRASTDEGVEISVDVGLFWKAKSFGGGILQLYTNPDNGSYELSGSNLVSEGYTAVNPMAEKHKIVVLRPRQEIQAVEKQAVCEVPRSWGGTSAVVYADAHQVVIGSKSNDYIVIDRQNGMAATRQLQCDDPDSAFYFTEDGGAVVYMPNGDVLVETDGTETYTAVKEENEMYSRDTAYWRERKELLMAQLERSQIVLWRNGVPETEIPLSEQLWLTNPLQYWDDLFVRVSDQGFILVGRMSNAQSAEVAIYELAAEKWVYEVSIGLASEKTITVSDDGTLLAYVDLDNRLQVFDFMQNETVASMLLELPCPSIEELCILPSYGYAAVRSRDHHIVIYSLDTQELLFHETTAAWSGDDLRFYHDPKNGRMYVMEGEDGFCVDPDSRAVLAEVQDMLYYDADTGVMYQRGYVDITLDSSERIAAVKIPGIQELVALGEQVLCLQ